LVELIESEMYHYPQSGIKKPRLFDRVRQKIQALHYSQRTEKTYIGWIKRFIFFHGKRHPIEMGEKEIMECLRLRIKDIDFSSNQIIGRDGKGNKDRITMLPGVIKMPLKEHRKCVWKIHQLDIKDGFGRVYLPYGLSRKYPNASREWH